MMIKGFDETLIEKGDVIGVALSGGRDSVALLYNLLELKNNIDFTVVGINVDHQIRGIESENDSKFCEKLCNDNAIKLFFSKIECVEHAKQNNLTLEEAARIKRYEFFDELLLSGKVNKIALGHHKNDNVETILFNLFRGSGANGVSGIKKVRGKYIRPLLNVSRDDINSYIKENDLPYVEDSTNSDVDYSRNYIRNVIIPKITEKFPNAIDSISRFSENISEEQSYLESIASEFVMFCEEKCSIDITNIHKQVFIKAVILSLRHLGITHEVYKVNYEDLWYLTSKQNGKRINLTQGIIAIKEYNKIVIQKNSTIPYFETDIKECSFDFCGNEYLIKKSKKREIGENTLSFDFDKLPKDAIIRSRKDGDIFRRASGSVKLKEYLIDKKIPSFERDKMLFIASENSILAVLCKECGVDLFIDENSNNIYTITIKE